MKRALLSSAFSAALLFMAISPSMAQRTINTPQASPKSTASQDIGLSTVSISYFSPAVKERKVWGGLVPYNEGKPFPWRAGANENTVVSFSHDVKIEGKELAAGTYGLHMIPREGNWTVIFSKNHTSWGSYFYKEEEDALRVDVKPETSTEHYEWLSYEFMDKESASAKLVMRWEKVKVGLKIEIDAHEVALNSMRSQLRNLPAFTWEGWNAAASYCANNNINHEEALTWSENSLRRAKNFGNLSVKATLLRQMGKEKEAKETMAEALPLATNQQLNAYGYQLLNLKKYDDAVAAFKLNTKRNPTDPNVWDSLGEGYFNKGDKKNAIKSFKKSLSLDPSAGVKANSEKYLKELGAI